MEDITAYLNRRINAVLGNSLMDKVVVDDIIVTENVHRNLNRDGLILEAKTIFNPIPGVNHYTYRIDKQQGVGGPGRQRHIHIYYDGKEFFAMNADATAHDGCHQVKIPDELVPFLKKKNFPLPNNNIIEMRILDQDTQTLICEDLDYEAVNMFVFGMGEALRHIGKIAIIEANVDTYQVKGHSKVSGKYTHVNQLSDVPDRHISEVKRMLIELLTVAGKMPEVIGIFDDNLISQHNLFVAWNDLF